jgi:hypothetical protein
MKIYFAGTGGLRKKDIIRTNKLAKRRLLSFYHILHTKIQLKIFKNITK